MDPSMWGPVVCTENPLPALLDTVKRYGRGRLPVGLDLVFPGPWLEGSGDSGRLLRREERNEETRAV